MNRFYDWVFNMKDYEEMRKTLHIELDKKIDELKSSNTINGKIEISIVYRVKE